MFRAHRFNICCDIILSSSRILFFPFYFVSLKQAGSTSIAKSTDPFFNPETLGAILSGFLMGIFCNVSIIGISFTGWGVLGDSGGNYGSLISLNVCRAQIVDCYFDGNYGNPWYDAAV